MRYDEQQAAVAAAAADFPETFGLRAYPGDRFRIEARSSFYSEETGVQLVVQRFCRDEAERVKYGLPAMVNDFTRDAPAAIRAQLVPSKLEAVTERGPREIGGAVVIATSGGLKHCPAFEESTSGKQIVTRHCTRRPGECSGAHAWSGWSLKGERAPAMKGGAR